MTTTIQITQVSQNHQTSKSSRPKSTEIRRVRNDLEKAQLYRFRFKIYVEQMGRDRKLADFKRRFLSDPLDESGINIAAYQDNQIIGAIRINLSEDSDFGEEELYRSAQFERDFPGKLALTTKLIVDPAHRGSRLCLRLCKEAFIAGAERGVQRHIIATSDSLVPLFKKLGFVQYRPRTTWLDYGSSNPMVLDPTNHEHLRKCGSPLAGLAEELYPQFQVA